MAHPCFSCGSECYCHGDIDDVILRHTPSNCEGCGCDDDDWDEVDDDDWDDEEEDFDACSGCDGHEACRDFGCAIDLGLGNLRFWPVASPLSKTNI